jgi:hypothetical protein
MGKKPVPAMLAKPAPDRRDQDDDDPIEARRAAR